MIFMCDSPAHHKEMIWTIIFFTTTVHSTVVPIFSVLYINISEVCVESEDLDLSAQLVTGIISVITWMLSENHRCDENTINRREPKKNTTVKTTTMC